MKNPIVFSSSHTTTSVHRHGKTNPFMLLLLVLTGSTIMAQQSNTISHQGKSFIFAFPSGSNPVTVSFTAVKIPTVVVVEYPKGVNTSITASPDEFAYWSTSDYSFPADGNSISNTSAVRLHADQDVEVFLTTGSSNIGEKSLALPIASLNSKHVILDNIVDSPDYVAEFSVTAPFDNTIVRITPSTPLTGHSVVGKSFQFVLNAGQTYYGASTYESQGATGTIVEANKRVAVANGYNSPSASFEMAQPLQNWGTSYVGAPLGSRYRIVVSQPNTVIKLNGKVHATLSPLSFQETIVNGPAWFTSSKPFFVVQFGISNAMVNLVPVDQYLNKYTIELDYSGTIYIIASQSDVGNLKLNNFPVAADKFHSINGTTLATASVAVDKGTYTTSSAHGHGLAAASVKLFYGGSHCFTGGFKKSRLAAPQRNLPAAPQRKLLSVPPQPSARWLDINVLQVVVIFFKLKHFRLRNPSYMTFFHKEKATMYSRSAKKRCRNKEQFSHKPY